jgi:hypothetical protein
MRLPDTISAADYQKLSKTCPVSKKGRLIVSGDKILPEFESKVKKPLIEKKVTIPTISKGKEFIENTIIQLKIDYSKEYKFLPDRKFRFDFYLPYYKVGIEYDGIFSDKSRHTGIVGFTRDTDKTNLAQIAGFKVLRYTAKNYKDFYNHLRTIIYKY